MYKFDVHKKCMAKAIVKNFIPQNVAVLTVSFHRSKFV